MDETGETCKLCLKYIQGANLAILEETLLGKLEFLLMDLEQSVDDSNSVCKECEDKIENAFEFKSCLVNTESCLAPYVSEDRTQKVNLKVILEEDSPGTSAEKDVCRLCKNFTNSLNVISLTKILKDDSITEIFQGHIPEMDLHVTENPMVCESCQKSLDSFSALVASWSIAIEWNVEDMKDDIDNIDMIQVKEENINELTETNTNSSVDINDISGSAQTYSKSKRKYEQDVEVKKEIDDVPDSIENVSGDNTAIKKEEENEEDGSGDTEMGHLQLKNEEIDIKDEDGKPLELRTPQKFSKYLQTGTNSLWQKKFKQKLELMMNHCPEYSNQTLNKKVLLVHDKKSYPCDRCSFEAFNKIQLKIHSLSHKNLNELVMYHCHQCPYNTKLPANWKNHQLIHKLNAELEEFDNICQICFYQTNDKIKFDAHILTHKDSSKIQYEGQQVSLPNKSKLQIQFLDNNTPKEIFKCDQCSYETRYNWHLKTHLVNVHSITDESLEYRCQQCPYVTKQRTYLQRHLQFHKNEKKQLIRCQHCSYETKKKASLDLHMLIHKRFEDVETYKCQQCDFKTKYKSSIVKHVERRHKNSS